MQKRKESKIPILNAFLVYTSRNWTLKTYILEIDLLLTMFLFTYVEGKIYFGQMRNESSSDHSWNNMDNDILVKIFMTLNVMDLITSVSQVCNSWRSACREPVLWKKLDLRMLKPIFVCNPPKPYPWSNRLSTKILMSVLKRSLNLSRGNATFLIFNFFECIKEEHLIFTAKRYQVFIP